MARSVRDGERGGVCARESEERVPDHLVEIDRLIDMNEATERRGAHAR